MRFTKPIPATILLFGMLTIFGSCSGQHQPITANNREHTAAEITGDTVSDLGKNIGCIFQDKNDHYWFASNGEGVYRYDGRTLIHITDKNGLISNYVLKIEEDVNGNLWFSTTDGVCCYNGISFTNYTGIIKNALSVPLKYTKGGLFFGHLNGLYFYNGISFTGFTIHPHTYHPSPYNQNRPYSVYSTLIDNAGYVWFGTQEKGVCRYDGKSYVFFTEQGLDKAAVRTLFQDKAGNIWAGNNGAGLFKFNGKAFINFTNEHGLANPGFLQKLQGKEGTLARPWAINEDNQGNLWIGTIDAGLWKYDGTVLTNYTTKDGLAGNEIWTIYKDKKGELWFVTNGDAICKFNGKNFTRFSFN